MYRFVPVALLLSGCLLAGGDGEECIIVEDGLEPDEISPIGVSAMQVLETPVLVDGTLEWVEPVSVGVETNAEPGLASATMELVPTPVNVTFVDAHLEKGPGPGTDAPPECDSMLSFETDLLVTTDDDLLDEHVPVLVTIRDPGQAPKPAIRVEGSLGLSSIFGDLLITTDPPNPGYGRIGIMMEYTGDEILLGSVSFLPGCPDDDEHCWGSVEEIGIPH